ncbi:MAG TPA: site-2 protease family protein [Candidatus Saccharimonadales bacterium]
MFSGLSGADIAIVFVSLIISMTLHEAMHGFVAHWLGDTTAADAGRLTLNPLRHIDTLTTLLLPLVLIILGLPPIFAAKPVPFNPARLKYDEYGAALVGAAGPLTNLVLAVFASLVLKAVGPESNIFTAVGLFLEVNVAFFVFNMIPIPPLDGSRVLYAFAPDFLREIMERIESAGLGIIFFFVAIFALVPSAGNFIANIDTSVINFLLLH